MADEAVKVNRTVPFDKVAEQSVLGSMLMDEDAIVTVSEILSADDFYNHDYGIIFETMVELQRSGKGVDLVILHDKLLEKDVPPEVSSLEYVREFVNAVQTSANVKHYAEIVYEKSVLRKLIKTTSDITNTCYEGKDSLESILETTEKKVFDIVQRRNSDGFAPIKDVVINSLDMIEKASKHKGTVTGIPSGFSALDYMTSGFQPSDLILLAARPAMGKTAFALNIALHAAMKENRTVAIFSLEMSKEQLVNRLLSMESTVDSKNIKTGTLSDKEWDLLVQGASAIGKSKLVIDDPPGININELRSKCRKQKLEGGLDMVVIDYLQLMTGSGRSDSRQQEVSDISRALKGLARELNIPIIALSQLSRKVEERPDHRPMMSDLRESGAIEQDADMVMFIYRDDYYNKDTDKPNVAEVIIGKHRNGPVGMVELTWLPQLTQFKNYEKSTPKTE